MGLIRKVKRGKLKKELLNQAKLENYSKKFDFQIASLEQKIKHYVQMVKEGSLENNQEKIKQGILYTKTAEEHLRHMWKLKNTIEAAKMNLDSQAAYDKFVEALQDFSQTFKDEQVKRRKIKKTVNKFSKGSKRIQNQVDIIEKKLSKLDKITIKSFEKNSKENANQDVETFLKEHSA